MNKVFLLLIIITIICMSYISYRFIHSSILEPLCITNTNSSIQLKYYLKNNTVLVNVLPSGIWAWFDGNDTYVYGQTMTDNCDSNFTAAYKLPKTAEIGIQYKCVEKLDNLIKEYSTINPRYLFIRNRSEKFGIVEAMNAIATTGVISF